MLDWLAETWNDFVNFAWRIVLSVFEMLKDLFIWIIEQLFNIGILLLDGLGALMSGLNVASYWGGIPPETAAMLSQIGLSEAIGMVLICLPIRFLLQTIPFVRWGS